MIVLDRPHSAPEAALRARFAAIVGAEGVLQGEAMAPYVTDVYRRLQTPMAVVRPSTVEALQAVVREAAKGGLAICARGGGASYTDGYLPQRAASIVIDLGGLDRIVEINSVDAWVTVEAGVTWAALKAALDPLGLRTPFFGPFSGLAATIGGSVSQHTLSHGSSAHGISAQSILGLEVVIASGDLLRTGSAAAGASPHVRFHGPDLTGPFTGDCGALGVKARITLPLLKIKPFFRCASFAFSNLVDLAGAMRTAALERLDDENFALDAALTQGQIARQGGSGAVLGMARSVLASSPDFVSGVVQLARMAAAGTREMRAAGYTLHVILEGVSDREVREKLQRLRQLMVAGREVPSSVPTVVRGMPFAPLSNTLGPRGERWIPVHGILAHSKVAAFHAALNALYLTADADMNRLGVWKGEMFSTVGSSGFLYEIALYWHGAQTAYHAAAVPANYLAKLPVYVDDVETKAFIETLKQQIIALYGQFGATHFQLGKVYPYADVLAPETLSLLQAIKQEVDPKRLMNPGALGL